MHPDSIISGLSPWDKRSSQSVEQICPGVSRFWLHKAQIVCYSVSTITRPAIDAWMRETLALINTWPLNRTYLSIHDVSEVTLTPYMRKKVAEVNLQMPKELRGRSAVIVPRTFINQMMRLFVTIELAQKNRSVQRDVFFRLEEATVWLEKALQPGVLPESK